MASFDLAIPIIFKHEGGYQAHPKDSGNWSSGKVGEGVLIGTKYGISAPTLIAWRGKMVTPEDMKNLTEEEAKRIFKARYWDPLNLDKVKDQKVAELIFDAADGSGVGLAKKHTVRALNNIGINVSEYSVDAINRANPVRLFNALKEVRINFFKSIAANDPNKAVFLKGWLNRMAKYVYENPGKSGLGLMVVFVLGVLLFLLFFK
ncbi:MAG: glycosyl hydrolase 108 family protein [Bacteroidota bacterium]